MSEFIKTSSDLRPVVNVDVAQNTSEATLNQVVSAATVNLVGPKLQFGTITFNGHVTGSEVKTVIDTLQQLAVVYMYEFTTGASDDTLAVATYPAGAWDFSNTGSVDVAVSAALDDTCTTAATATFTN
jgi:hypothetical protein